MSRWARDREAAADALIGRSLDALDLSGRILTANASGGLPAMLAERGIACQRWDRRLGHDGVAQPWPPPGPFELAIVRLAKAKDEQEMTAHAVLSVLAPRARLLLYGGNDEGIRSAVTALAELCGPVDTIAKRGHGRVLAVRRPPQLARLRQDLAAWRRVGSLSIAGRARPWVTYPGLFAAGHLDAGTALLVGTLPRLAYGAHVADFGCGSGVIGAALAGMAAEHPNPAGDLDGKAAVHLDLIDHDSVALLAAQENVPGARVILGTSLQQAKAEHYDAIFSNPPLHAGLSESHAAVEALVREAPQHLRLGGCLQIVLQRRIALERLLAAQLKDVCVVADNGRYRVWQARRG
jgi:16S rRNA (guanine1207-N2)-methyltransferase